MAIGISLITFDVGNVMIRLSQNWAEACARAGLPYRGVSFSTSERASLREMESQLEQNGMDMPSFLTRLCQLFRYLYTPDETARLYQAIIGNEIPGIHELVLTLHAMGYRTACLSNTCAAHWEDLSNPLCYPAIGALDYRHASHLFKCAKPDARIYRLFEEATNTTADAILFFDDRRENIEAARQCGWHAVHISNANSSLMQIREGLSNHEIVL